MNQGVRACLSANKSLIFQAFIVSIPCCAWLSTKPSHGKCGINSRYFEVKEAGNLAGSEFIANFAGH